MKPHPSKNIYLYEKKKRRAREKDIFLATHRPEGTSHMKHDFQFQEFGKECVLVSNHTILKNDSFLFLL